MRKAVMKLVALLAPMTVVLLLATPLVVIAEEEAPNGQRYYCVQQALATAFPSVADHSSMRHRPPFHARPTTQI